MIVYIYNIVRHISNVTLLNGVLLSVSVFHEFMYNRTKILFNVLIVLYVKAKKTKKQGAKQAITRACDNAKISLSLAVEYKYINCMSTHGQVSIVNNKVTHSHGTVLSCRPHLEHILLVGENYHLFTRAILP